MLGDVACFFMVGGEWVVGKGVKGGSKGGEGGRERWAEAEGRRQQGDLYTLFLYRSPWRQKRRRKEGTAQIDQQERDEG